MKVYIKEIDCCNACPNTGVDQNGIRWECKAMSGKFLSWMVNDDHIKIPKWCPLPMSSITYEFLDIDEMKL